MGIDEQELHTESFHNARGWTVVRVTHLPTETVAERTRSDALRSAVQAQRECVEELERRLADGEQAAPEDEENDGLVTRAEFRALEARVARLEGTGP